ELDWLNQKALDKKRQEFDRYRRHRFSQKTVKYVIVNIFLVSLNIISAGAITWSLYILLLWGLVLTLEAWTTFQAKGEAYEQAFQHWHLKNEVKQSLTSLWNKLKRAWQA
ncbi:MAG: 2TM domain-containing protein, partial [Microcystaceae cyanobacterium]